MALSFSLHKAGRGPCEHYSGAKSRVRLPVSQPPSRPPRPNHSSRQAPRGRLLKPALAQGLLGVGRGAPGLIPGSAFTLADARHHCRRILAPSTEFIVTEAALCPAPRSESASPGPDTPFSLTAAPRRRAGARRRSSSCSGGRPGGGADVSGWRRRGRARSHAETITWGAEDRSARGRGGCVRLSQL